MDPVSGGRGCGQGRLNGIYSRVVLSCTQILILILQLTSFIIEKKTKCVCVGERM